MTPRPEDVARALLGQGAPDMDMEELLRIIARDPRGALEMGSMGRVREEPPQAALGAAPERPLNESYARMFEPPLPVQLPFVPGGPAPMMASMAPSLLRNMPVRGLPSLLRNMPVRGLPSGVTPKVTSIKASDPDLTPIRPTIPLGEPTFTGVPSIRTVAERPGALRPDRAPVSHADVEQVRRELGFPRGEPAQNVPPAPPNAVPSQPARIPRELLLLLAANQLLGGDDDQSFGASNPGLRPPPMGPPPPRAVPRDRIGGWMDARARFSR